jgi:hypothetical protein
MDDATPPVTPLSQVELDRLTDLLIEKFKTVFDPEIPVDIYELGLIYKVDIEVECLDQTGANDLLREKFHCTVMGVHHTNKLGDMRGSSVFNGAGDCLLEVRREEGAEVGELYAKKIKSAQDGWSIQFKLNSTPTGDIKGTTSLVPSLTTAPVRVESDFPDRTICQSILNAIQAAWDQKQPWSPYPQAKVTGRYAASIIATRWNLPAEQAERMLQRWLEAEILGYDTCDVKLKLKGLTVRRNSGGTGVQHPVERSSGGTGRDYFD